LGREIHATNGKAQTCTQGALLIFLLSLGGKDFLSFSLGYQCVSTMFPMGSHHVFKMFLYFMMGWG